MQLIKCPQKSLKGWIPETDPFDIAVVASFSYFIPPALIDWFKMGTLNAHPSLLPLYRGAAPIQRSMIDGQLNTGVSIIELSKASFDAGSIYLQSQTKLDALKPYHEVEMEFAHLSGELLAKVIDNWDHCHRHRYDQVGTSTMAPKITKDDAFVSFRQSASTEIYRKFLAIGHQENIRGTLGTGRLVHLLDMHLVDCDTSLEPGQCCFDKRTSLLKVGCSDGRCVGAQQFRVEGKSTTFNARSFYSDFKLANTFFT